MRHQFGFLKLLENCSRITIPYYYHFVRHCGAFCRLKCILACCNKPIKSENQIIEQSKQPIKLEKPFQSLLTFTHSKKKYSLECFEVIFSVFIFSMPSKVIIIVTEFVFFFFFIFFHFFFIFKLLT